MEKCILANLIGFDSKGILSELCSDSIPED